jgi:Flp pilus assembly protein protease CpaA
MQTFENHAHRPVATAVGYMFLIIALTAFSMRWMGGGRATFAAGLLALCASVATLLVISRTYVTRLQDRIIKLEMRVRTAALLTPDQQRLLTGLDNKRIAALRFASDAELPALLERAVREKLPPKEIKRAVRTWTPDNDRT